MAYAAVDKDGSEYIYEEEPKRVKLMWAKIEYDNECVELPKGSIERLIGYELTWEDEPVELKENR